MSTPVVNAERCTASPDHADIIETIENASDDWQKNGYTSALAEVRDMANVGRALMEALPVGYSYMNCPSEIVSDLQNERVDAARERCPDLSDIARLLFDQRQTRHDFDDAAESDTESDAGTLYSIVHDDAAAIRALMTLQPIGIDPC